MKPVKLVTAIAVAMLTLSSVAAQAKDLKIVEVITSPARTKVLQAQVNEFKKANPSDNVEIVTIPWDGAFEKVLVMFKSGQIPDIIEMPGQWASLFIKGKQLLPLDAYLKTSTPLKTVQPAVLQTGKFGTASTYEIPTVVYLKGLFVNTKLLAQAGVKAPKNWSEFSKVAEAVSKIPGKYGYCMRGGKGSHAAWTMISLGHGGTGKFFDDQGNSTFTNPEVQKGVQALVDIYQKGHAPKESVSWGFAETVSGFSSGVCAMLDQDPDALIDIKAKMNPDDFTVVPMPVAANGKGFPATGFSGWSITQASANKDEAWKLVEFLSSKEKTLEWAEVNSSVPTHTGSSDSGTFKDPAFRGWFETLAHADIYTPTLPPIHLPEFGMIADKMILEDGQELLLGKRTVAEVTAKWAAKLTEAQKKYLASK